MRLLLIVYIITGKKSSQAAIIPTEWIMIFLIFRISEMLHNFFKLFSEPNKIGICATSESVEKLNKHLFYSRGSHLFKNLYTIAELSKVSKY